MAVDPVYRCELCKQESAQFSFVVSHGASCPVLANLTNLPIVVSFVPTLPCTPVTSTLPASFPPHLAHLVLPNG